MPKLVWKVVRVIETDDDTVYTSAYVVAAGLRLAYQIGKVTRPTIGRLFAFMDLDAAKRWAPGVVGETAILECETDWIDSSGVIHIPASPSLEGAVQYWRGKWEGYIPFAPSGTVLCPTLLPIGEV